jgi:signal transduction histidine kinase
VSDLSNKISGTASEAAQKMNTLIWALNTENDSVDNLCEYTRQYCIAFFEGTDIAIHFEEKLLHPNSSIHGTARKNIFLCIKEALHNILKHADASEVHIHFTYTGAHQLIVSVADNGKGILHNNQFGNGLKNMQHRMAAIGGKASFSSNDGLTVVFECILH